MPDPAAQWRLKPLQVFDLTEPVEVPPGGLLLGRDLTSGVVIDGQRYPQVSHLHARVSLQEGHLVVEDLDSRNGTSVNGAAARRTIIQEGDLIQLGGSEGPRFLVTSDLRTDATAVVHHPAAQEPPRSMGKSTIIRLRQALGLPADAERAMKSARRPVRLLAVGLAVTLIILAAAGWVVRDRIAALKRGEEESGRRLVDLKELNESLRALVDQAHSRLADQQRLWEEERARLVAARDNDLRKIDALEKAQEKVQANAEKADTAVALQMQEVWDSLSDTTAKLEQYNPLNLQREQAVRREKLQQILRSIVFIESEVRFRERESGRVLLQVPGEEKSVTLKTEGEGDPLIFTGSGSGFCISAEGWILTNAHVVRDPDLVKLDSFHRHFVADKTVTVAFSGNAERREAKVWTVAEDEQEDMALLKIEPAEGLFVLPDFDAAERTPVQGAPVNLFGFPLGRRILRGESPDLAASVFSGIVSRTTEGFIQVQAAVYPGNSGGPVVDEDGRVVGIVTAVQTIPSGQIASDIGYVIPITRAKKVWPPREKPAEKAKENGGSR